MIVLIPCLVLLLLWMPFLSSRLEYVRAATYVNIGWLLLVLANRLRLSDLQIDWSVGECLFISTFLSVVTIAAFLAYAPVRRVLLAQWAHRPPVAYGVSIQRITLLIYLALAILVADLFVNGLPALASDRDFAKLQPRLPFLYSFAQDLLYCSLAFVLLYYRRITKRLAIDYLLLTVLYLAHSFLVAGRGNFVNYIVVSIVAYYLYFRIELKYKYLVMFLVAVFVVTLFGLAGNAREGTSFSINQYGGFSDSIPSALAWLYGYVFVNIDNLILVLRAHDVTRVHEYKTLMNMSPTLLHWLGGNIVGIEDLPYIGRFNLSTGFGYLAYDYGYAGMCIFSFIVLSLYFVVIDLARHTRSIFWQSIDVLYTSSLILFPLGNVFLTSRGVLLVFCVVYIRLAAGLRIRRVVTSS